MKDLFIRGHLGLGDHILTNGLVRHFAPTRRDHVILLPCKKHNVPSVKWMFSDLANVEVLPVQDDAEADRCAQAEQDAGTATVLRLTGSGNGFDRQMYEQAGVPFEERWSGFYAPLIIPSFMAATAPRPYAFVHDDPTRGFVIPPLMRVRELRPAGQSYAYHPENIFEWRQVLETACEIHCIPSSFSVLVDSIDLPPDTRLYLHVSARPGCELPTYRKNWKHL